MVNGISRENQHGRNRPTHGEEVHAWMTPEEKKHHKWGRGGGAWHLWCDSFHTLYPPSSPSWACMAVRMIHALSSFRAQTKSHERVQSYLVWLLHQHACSKLLGLPLGDNSCPRFGPFAAGAFWAKIPSDINMPDMHKNQHPKWSMGSAERINMAGIGQPMERKCMPGWPL